MAKVQQIIQPDPSPFAAEFAAIYQALTDPAHTPEAITRCIADQINELRFPEGREAAVKDVLGQFAKFIRDQRLNLARQSTLVREASEFHQSALALARPVPTATPEQQVRNVFGALQDTYNWASATIELLFTYLQKGEVIQSVDADGITTNVRRIGKAQLIIDCRPRSMTADKYPIWERLHTRPEALKATRPGPE
jgi:hypothetical protein